MKYAVIENVSIWHEGDERSRTHPGHGYDAHYTTHKEFRTFDNLEALTSWIKIQDKYKKFVAIKYEELTVTTEVVINVKD